MPTHKSTNTQTRLMMTKHHERNNPVNPYKALHTDLPFISAASNCPLIQTRSTIHNKTTLPTPTLLDQESRAFLNRGQKTKSKASYTPVFLEIPFMFTSRNKRRDKVTNASWIASSSLDRVCRPEVAATEGQPSGSVFRIQEGVEVKVI